MIMALRGILALAGLLFVYTGAQFFIDPVGTADNFGFAPNNSLGTAAIRGDMTAFFLLGAGCLIWGAWRRNGDILLIPAALFGMALLGRTVTYFTHGPSEGYFMPMIVEAVMVILTLIASRILPHRDPAAT